MVDYYQWERWSWDDERDLKSYPGWMCDPKDTVRTRSFLDLWMCLDVYCDYCSYAAEWLQIPTVKGPDWRLKDGWIYVAVNVVPENERPPREAEFRKRIAPWTQNQSSQRRLRCEDRICQFHSEI